MPPWQFVLWQGLGMLLYGCIGLAILWRLEDRRHLTWVSTDVWLDLMMVPFYAGAGVLAYFVITPAFPAAFLGWANAMGAAYMLWCSWRTHRKNKVRRQWMPNIP